MTATTKKITPSIQLYQALYQQIVSGEQAGRLPSTMDLARQFGVNQNTVQKVIRQLKEQRFVYGVQGKGVFVNPEGGVNILAQKNVMLYLHPAVMQFPFYMRLTYELRLRLERERCAVHFINSLPQLRAFASQIDVLLLFEQFDDDELAALEALVPRGRILCCNCRGPKDGGVIGTDNRAGGRQAMEHLYALGCRDVCVLALSDMNDPRSHFFHRKAGVADFAAEHPDLAVDVIDLPVKDFSGEERIDPGLFAAPFRDGRRPDGFFLFMDLMAFGLYDELRARNLRRPVLGFDDRDFAVQLRPSLSSLREDASGIAEAVLPAIRRRLAGDADAEQVLVPPTLAARESTNGLAP